MDIRALDNGYIHYLRFQYSHQTPEYVSFSGGIARMIAHWRFNPLPPTRYSGDSKLLRAPSLSHTRSSQAEQSRTHAHPQFILRHSESVSRPASATLPPEQRPACLGRGRAPDSTSAPSPFRRRRTCSQVRSAVALAQWTETRAAEPYQDALRMEDVT